MPGFGDLVQKAFYLGVGIASLAGEKAGTTLAQLRAQSQKLADELVARGEMSTEEARRFVDDMVSKAQQPQSEESSSGATSSEPRRIEILSDEEVPTQKESEDDVEKMRRQVKAMQEELRRLQRD